MYRSPEWRKRKQEFFKKYKKTCTICRKASNEAQIQLHHLNYDHPIGTEPDHSLTPLCGECHRSVHIYATQVADFYNLEEATVIYIRMVKGGSDPLRRPKKLSYRRKGKGKTQKRITKGQAEYNNYRKSARSRKARRRRSATRSFAFR